MLKIMCNFASENEINLNIYTRMKNTFTLLMSFVLAMIICVGCGNGKQSTTANMADPWDEQWGENPDTFTTPDLNWLSLRGHVKSMVMNGRTRFELDRDGNLTYLKLHGLSLDDLTRNPEGQIIKLTNLETAATEDVVIFEYGYDQRGFLEYEARFMPDGSHYHHYDLDRLGNVRTGTFDYQKGKTELHAVEMYKYPEVDSHGNWTKLIVTKNCEIEPTLELTREIEYYE